MPHSDIHKRKRKKNFILLAVLVGLIAIIWAVTMVKMAQAQDNYGEVYACGEVEEAYLETEETAGVCDYYTRRIDYLEEQKAFQALLDERRENYNAPRVRALKAYENALEAYR